jgi:hypothetical protein
VKTKMRSSTFIALFCLMTITFLVITAVAGAEFGGQQDDLVFRNKRHQVRLSENSNLDPENDSPRNKIYRARLNGKTGRSDISNLDEEKGDDYSPIRQND